MQQKTSVDEMTKERLKEIVVHHFYSFYVQRNMTDMLDHVDPDVRWIGSKEHFIARNKEGFRSVLKKELEYVPVGCAMKVVSAETVQVDEQSYSVNGILELRIPQEKEVQYAFLCFTMVIVSEEEQYSIVSIHTSYHGVNPIGNTVSDKGKSVYFMAEDIYNQNQHDTLTGLYTIDYFKKEVKKVLEENDSQHFALICTNVSHFERVNNMYGLKRADQILSDLANMITSCSLQVKVSCRSVADHFLALVSYDSESELKETLARLCDDFGHKMKIRYPDARPRLGIGVYRIVDKTGEVERMVECANIARKSLRF